MKTYELFYEPAIKREAFRCLICGNVSYTVTEIEARYCYHCRLYHEEIKDSIPAEFLSDLRRSDAISEIKLAKGCVLFWLRPGKDLRSMRSIFKKYGLGKSSLTKVDSNAYCIELT